MGNPMVRNIQKLQIEFTFLKNHFHHKAVAWSSSIEVSIDKKQFAENEFLIIVFFSIRINTSKKWYAQKTEMCKLNKISQFWN